MSKKGTTTSLTENHVHVVSEGMRSLTPLLIETIDEERAVRLVKAEAKAPVYVWNILHGLSCKETGYENSCADILQLMKEISDLDGTVIFCDFSQIAAGNALLKRYLKQMVFKKRVKLVFLESSSLWHQDMERMMIRWQIPLPTQTEILCDKKGSWNDAIGLTEYDITRTGDSYLEYKKLRITGGLKILSPKESFDDVVGLAQVKEWARTHLFCFPAAEGKLPYPRGVVLTGPPGCGKSLMIKAIAGEGKIPLIYVDISAMQSKWHGESERGMREATTLADTLGRCILWVDELERAISGTGSSNLTDGGTTDRQFGHLLFWQQERKSQALLCCTSNDLGSIPPQFVRQGRFDKVFFLERPSTEERTGLIRLYGKKYGVVVSDEETSILVEKTVHQSGADIEGLVRESLYVAFDQATPPCGRVIIETMEKRCHTQIR